MPEPKALETSTKRKLEKTSQRFRKLFLMKLTLELIKHSKVEEFFVLENLIKKRDKKTKEEEKYLEKKYGRGELIPSIMHREPFRRKKILEEPKPIFAPVVLQQPQKKAPPRMPLQPLTIPEYPLPPNLQYLRPTPSNIQIDLGKLNPLVQDQNIKAIECNGADENIIVKGGIGARTTNIILNKEEINQVLQKFSEASKIPIHEGIFKIVVGRLILSAIVSDVVGSKFIIRKMFPVTQPMQGFMPSTMFRSPYSYPG